MDRVEKRKTTTILIVDDSELNRVMLAAMLGENYEILEASDGIEALSVIQKYETSIDLVLLDIVMPGMDGFEVLKVMNQKHWIDTIPVIMISAENDTSYMEKAYELGATDYIKRPYESYIIHRRITNTLMLYEKQKRLLNMVEEQIYEKEKNNSMMINILGHIVEFRNGESGPHVHHVQTMTRLLLQCLMNKTNSYNLTDEDVLIISTASALHDIGKIMIDEKILNKPGKLTKEEFEQLIREDGLIEYAQYVENYYGTPRKYVEEQLSAGKDVILEIEIQGAMKIREKFPDTLLVFVCPPSMEELKNRLVGRGTETLDVINGRLRRAVEESRGMDKYDYLLINDDLEECVDTLHETIRCERMRTSRNHDFVSRIQKEAEAFL